MANRPVTRALLLLAPADRRTPADEQVSLLPYRMADDDGDEDDDLDEDEDLDDEDDDLDEDDELRDEDDEDGDDEELDDDFEDDEDDEEEEDGDLTAQRHVPTRVH